MDVTELAGALRVPALILCGSRDRVTPPALSRHLHATIAGSRLDLVDGAGHMLLIEASGVVNRAIAAFAASITRRPVARAPGRLAAHSLRSHRSVAAETHDMTRTSDLAPPLPGNAGARVAGAGGE